MGLPWSFVVPGRFEPRSFSTACDDAAICMIATELGGGGAVTPANFCFDPGGAGSIVLVRAYYTWKLILPVLNAGLKTVGAGDNRLIMSATSFRNEPYSPATPAPVPCPALP